MHITSNLHFKRKISSDIFISSLIIMQVFAFDHFLLKDYFQRIIFVVKFGYKMYSSTVIIFFRLKIIKIRFNDLLIVNVK
jgi:hypothetical protein